MHERFQRTQQLGQEPSPGVGGSTKITWRLKMQRWRQLRRERYALRELSDSALKDIGLSREQVQREARKPFWNDKHWCR